MPIGLVCFLGTEPIKVSLIHSFHENEAKLKVF